MKIAVISDIHSNFIALDLALNDLKKENVDKTVFLGDYITDGIKENEILETIKKNADYAIIGNREKYMLNYNPDKKDYLNYKPIATTYNNLTNTSIEYIKTLPVYKIIYVNNYKLLLIHGDGYYTKEKDKHVIFDEIMADYDFDICLFGHSHEYYYEIYKDKYFINPGSMGQSVDSPTYKYCILDLTKGINIELREFAVADTFSEYLSIIKSSSYYKDNYVWESLLLHSMKDGKDYCIPFIDKFSKMIDTENNPSIDRVNYLWETCYKEFESEYNFEEL